MQTENERAFADNPPVNADIYVNASACGCRNPKLQCERVIIESRGKNFTVRMLISDEEGDPGLGKWDLSTFRMPRSEKFQKAARNEKVKTLELKFSDPDGKLKTNIAQT